MSERIMHLDGRRVSDLNVQRVLTPAQTLSATSRRLHDRPPTRGKDGKSSALCPLYHSGQSPRRHSDTDR